MNSNGNLIALGNSVNHRGRTLYSIASSKYARNGGFKSQPHLESGKPVGFDLLFFGTDFAFMLKNRQVGFRLFSLNLGRGLNLPVKIGDLSNGWNQHFTG